MALWVRLFRIPGCCPVAAQGHGMAVWLACVVVRLVCFLTAMIFFRFTELARVYNPLLDVGCALPLGASW